MRYSTEHKDQTRAKIMAAAARVFREGGFGGAGIDGLTRAAGVTNGAFYGHFKSKADAFRAAVTSGLREVRDAVAAFRREHAAGWVPAFVRFYLGPRQEVPIGEACALPTLSSEVMRADLETREVYSAGLQSVLEVMTDGMPGDSATAREDAAIALLALLAGGAMLGRAVSDPTFAKRIHGAVEKYAAVKIPPQPTHSDQPPERSPSQAAPLPAPPTRGRRDETDIGQQPTPPFLTGAGWREG